MKIKHLLLAAIIAISCASLETKASSISLTTNTFMYRTMSPMVVGPDGSTLYGTTFWSGNGYGTLIRTTVTNTGAAEVIYTLDPTTEAAIPSVARCSSATACMLQPRTCSLATVVSCGMTSARRSMAS